MRSTRLLVKVCGLTDPAQAAACAQLGADWIGLNFYARSPRCISLERARAIVTQLPAEARAIGVFVNESSALIRETAAQLGLWAVQLHGDESPDELARLEGLRIVKAFRLRARKDWGAVSRFRQDCQDRGITLEGVLIDAHDPDLMGGTGRTIPAELLNCGDRDFRLILAGGLTDANVEEMAVLVKPWMVDVASGVECAPGVKDLGKLARFLESVRRAESRIIGASGRNASPGVAEAP